MPPIPAPAPATPAKTKAIDPVEEEYFRWKIGVEADYATAQLRRAQAVEGQDHKVTASTQRALDALERLVAAAYDSGTPKPS